MQGINIKIGTSADTAGIDKATSALKRADLAADDFVQSIKAGVGIDIGGRIVNSVAAIPGVFRDLISRGVEFNVEMNNAEVGISNVLAKFMDLDKVAAKREATKVMERLIELEPKAAGGLQDLVNGFMATGATALGMGLTIEQNIDLVGKFANALSNAGKPIEQLGQEMRSLLTGNATADSDLANILFGSSAKANEAIKIAKEAGNVYEIVSQKIGKFGEAGDSAAVRMSSFESAVNIALGKIAEPISTAFLDGIKEITDSINEADGTPLEQLGYQLAELVKTGVSFTKWATENSGVLVGMGKAVGILVAAYAAFKIANIVSGLTNKARAVLANKVAIDAETASLGANTAAQRSNATSRAAGSAGGRAAGRAGNIAGAAGLGVGLGLIAHDYLQGKAAEINARSDRTDQIGNQIVDVGGKYNDLIRGASSVAEKQEIIKGLEADIAKIRALASDATEEDAEMIERSAGLLERMLGTARNLSDEKLREKEATAAIAAEEKKAADAKAANAEKDAKMIAAAQQKGFDSARDRIAGQGIEGASDLAEKGDIAGAKAAFDELQQTYSDWLAQTKEQQGGVSGDELKANLELQDQLQGYLEAIKEARDDLPEAIAEAEKKANDERIATLEDERSLLEATGAKRLAELEALGLKEGTLANRRKAIEDEIAAKRLGLENQIGTLQEESALRREAREAAAAAASIQRQNQLTDAIKSTADAAKPGDLIAGTRRRRGLVTSDSFDQGSGLGVGQGVRPLGNFANSLAPLGSQGFGTNGTGLVPSSSVPSGPAAPGAPGTAAGNQQAGGSNPADPVKKAAQDAAKALQGITTAVEAMAKAALDAQKKVEASKAPEKLAGLGTSIKTADDKLQKQIDDVRAQL